MIPFDELCQALERHRREKRPVSKAAAAITTGVAAASQPGKVVQRSPATSSGGAVDRRPELAATTLEDDPTSVTIETTFAEDEPG